MKIGYACLCNGLPDAPMKTCILKSASYERLYEVISHNLDALDRILEYNKKSDILMFRISSDIIPFASHPEIAFDWKGIFADKLREIGQKAKAWNMRLSMHPGQYTVLNSPDEQVVSRAALDLQYHTDFLDALGMDGTHKLILHIGGIYGDKEAAAARFCKAYRKLDSSIRRRLVIENDDRLYNAHDVLTIALAEGIPAVFDTLHHAVLPSGGEKTEPEWVAAYAATWTKADGGQKMHFAQQQPGKKPGSHSDTIAAEPFVRYYQMLQENGLSPDIMLEVKDKDISAQKCVACLHEAAAHAREQWEKYRYAVLERGARIYQALEEKAQAGLGTQADRLRFFMLLEEAMALPPAHADMCSAAKQVWDLLAPMAEEKAAKEFARRYADAQKEEKKVRALKRFLMRTAQKLMPETLWSSYYFLDCR